MPEWGQQGASLVALRRLQRAPFYTYPARTISAGAAASLPSVLAGTTDSAASAWRASIQIIGTPADFSPFHSQTDKGPVSRPARATSNGPSALAIGSGPVGTLRSANAALLNDADRSRLRAAVQPGILLHRADAPLRPVARNEGDKGLAAATDSSLI